MDMKRNISVFLLTAFVSALMPAVSFGQAPANRGGFPPVTTPPIPMRGGPGTVSDDFLGNPVVFPPQANPTSEDPNALMRRLFNDPAFLIQSYVSQAADALRDLTTAQRTGDPQAFPAYRAAITRILQDLNRLSASGVPEDAIKAAQDTIMREYITHVPPGQVLRDDPLVLTAASMGVNVAIGVITGLGISYISYRYLMPRFFPRIPVAPSAPPVLNVGQANMILQGDSFIDVNNGQLTTRPPIPPTRPVGSTLSFPRPIQPPTPTGPRIIRPPVVRPGPVGTRPGGFSNPRGGTTVRGVGGFLTLLGIVGPDIANMCRESHLDDNLTAKAMEINNLINKKMALEAKIDRARYEIDYYTTPLYQEMVDQSTADLRRAENDLSALNFDAEYNRLWGEYSDILRQINSLGCPAWSQPPIA